MLVTGELRKVEPIMVPSAELMAVLVEKWDKEIVEAKRKYDNGNAV